MVRRALLALLALSTCRPSGGHEVVAAPVAVRVEPGPSSDSAPAMVEALPVPSSEPAPPLVDVRTIGMHIGGGPNDDATKAPFLASIEAHRVEFARCFVTLPATADFGVDARVPAKGGRAKIDRPRSTVKAPMFQACAMGVFAAMEFLPPKSGAATMVSVSLRGSRLAL